MASTLFPHAKLDWTISRLEGVLAERPDDLDSRLELARCTLSRGLFHGGDEAACNQALAMARKVLQDDPTSIDALVLAGFSLVGMDRADAALKYLSQALAAEAERADLQLALGALKRIEGNLGAAVRYFETSCRLAPEAWETHLWLGRASWTWRKAVISNAGWWSVRNTTLCAPCSLSPARTSIRRS